MDNKKELKNIGGNVIGATKEILIKVEKFADCLPLPLATMIYFPLSFVALFVSISENKYSSKWR